MYTSLPIKANASAFTFKNYSAKLLLARHGKTLRILSFNGLYEMLFDKSLLKVLLVLWKESSFVQRGRNLESEM